MAVSLKMLKICWHHNYVVEAKQVNDDSSFALRQTRGMIFRGNKLTAGLLRSPQNPKAIMKSS